MRGQVPTVRSLSYCSASSVILVGLVLGGITGLAFAEQRAIDVEAVKVITSAESESRVLVKVGSLAVLNNKLVRAAHLVFPASRNTLSRDLEIMVMPLTRSWDENSATWTSPWTNAGGDYDEDYSRTEKVAAGVISEDLRVDVSLALRDMAFGELDNYGFLLSVSQHLGRGFTNADIQSLGSLSGGSLIVHYRHAGRVRPGGEG